MLQAQYVVRPICPNCGRAFGLDVTTEKWEVATNYVRSPIDRALTQRFDVPCECGETVRLRFFLEER